jgi:glycosyltransferase involved in cell wall biosynthesis
VLATAEQVNALKKEQYEASDLIIANSDFVKASFVEHGVPASKIVVVPGAGPGIRAEAENERLRERVIFISAGAQSVRKGTPYLLRAWKKVGRAAGAELRLVGKSTLPERLASAAPDGVTFESTVSQAELFAKYRAASVLVLPSLCEGFALVILEAMAHGLPVITTPNSGAGEFVKDGINGWIVPIRDVDALADRIRWCIENPDALVEMGRRSREIARRWTWSEYVPEHASVVRAAAEAWSVV